MYAIIKDMSGEIIIPAGVNVWPHELETAKAKRECVDIYKKVR